MSLGNANVRMFVPAGHYASPIVDTEELRGSTFDRRRTEDKVLGVNIDLDAMERLFRQLASLAPVLPLPDSQLPTQRYHQQNTMYGIGDAGILSRMIHYFRPGRIIEDLRIDLPRPRDPRSTRELAAFGKYIVHLGELMGVV